MAGQSWLLRGTQRLLTGGAADPRPAQAIFLLLVLVDLVLRVARIKNDLAEVRALDLSLVMAGPEGASVLSAEARVEPATDARSDWFVRRMPEPLADTLPG